MKLDQIRSQFPETQVKVYGKPLVYLDNAATSMRPMSVVHKWTEMSTVCNANLHRAVHHVSDLATAEYENTRAAVAAYLGAAGPEEIVFTAGATSAINLVAFSFGEAIVKEGDEIIVSEAEHHSNIVPWQMMCIRKGAVLKVLPVKDNGELDVDALPSLISERTRLVAVCHISNVLGIVNPVARIVEIAHSRGCAVLVDGAQGIVHSVVDVKEIGADFYVFSGHKIYAAPGTGVLYAKKEWLDRLPPYMGGGEMIESVKWSGTSYTRAPYKFEAGTQNISGTPTLVPALEMAKSLREQETQEDEIRNFVYDALMSDERIRLFGTPEDLALKAPLFSFCTEGVHHEDLALILDKMGVAVRSGQMCAEPLMDRFGVTGMLRASFSPINTREDAQYFLKSLDKAIKMLQ